MAQFRTSRVFDVFFVAALAGLLWLAFVHKTAVNDWIYFMSHSPTSQAVQVAADAGLSPAGAKLLYRGDPEFTVQSTIEGICSSEKLGCLDERGKIFILDDPTNHDQSVVTAAHEMLHLAYRRLPQSEKDRLGPLIDQAILMNGDAIQSELEGQATPDDRRDEAHSLLGTEYVMMPPELETYYSKYFTDRTKVVAAYTRSMQ